MSDDSKDKKDLKEVVKEKISKKDKDCDPKEKLNEIVSEMEKVAKDLKKKFDKSDEKTKQKLIAAGAGAIGLIAGVLGVAASKSKHKK